MPRTPQPLLFPRRRLIARVPDAARYYGVSERTVWRWIEKAAIPVERTPGGGVRILDERVVEAVTSSDEG